MTIIALRHAVMRIGNSHAVGHQVACRRHDRVGVSLRQVQDLARVRLQRTDFRIDIARMRRADACGRDKGESFQKTASIHGE